MIIVTTEMEELIANLEATLTPKQLKVVNFMVGQTMGACKKKGMNGANPKLIRQMVIWKLAEATYEPEEEAK